MNDVEKVSSGAASSQSRTPAYANFDYHTTKIDYLLRFMNEGAKGIKKQVDGIGEQVVGVGRALVDDLRKTLAQREYTSGIANDVTIADQREILTTAEQSLTELQQSRADL